MYNLNGIQEAAVLADKSSFLLGPAGCGKSTVLHHRLLSLLTGGEPAYTFLVLVAEPEHVQPFMDQIHQQYVITARSKGLTKQRVLYGHVFRNAMLIVIAGFPSAFIGVLFTGALLIEVIFSLNGLGLLGFEAVIQRDYPIMFGTLYFFTLLGLLMGLIGDLAYMIIDPRIDFESREV